MEKSTRKLMVNYTAITCLCFHDSYMSPSNMTERGYLRDVGSPVPRNGVFFAVCPLFLQCLECGFEGGDTRLGVGLLLALKGNDLGLGVMYETLVAEFLHHAREETALVREVCLQFRALGIYIGELIHRNAVLVGADAERGRLRALLCANGYFHIRQLAYQRVDRLGCHQRQHLLGRDILACADMAEIRNQCFLQLVFMGFRMKE